MIYRKFDNNNKSTHNTDNVKYIEEYGPNVNKWTVVNEIDLEKLQ